MTANRLLRVANGVHFFRFFFVDMTIIWLERQLQKIMTILKNEQSINYQKIEALIICNIYNELRLALFKGKHKKPVTSLFFSW